MQFVATTLMFAAAAMAHGAAHGTVYQTVEVTITSCAATVTNCPVSCIHETR